ncbi:hypothetical protein PG994_011615 [Apiospora phragmitis]|uniref:Uncharacterized protein n=1 Tax=Apiospora phragmitis TaxID=2905665 RepID=A0ABR1TT97_9PEZI
MQSYAQAKPGRRHRRTSGKGWRLTDYDTEDSEDFDEEAEDPLPSTRLKYEMLEETVADACGDLQLMATTFIQKQSYLRLANWEDPLAAAMKGFEGCGQDTAGILQALNKVERTLRIVDKPFGDRI